MSKKEIKETLEIIEALFTIVVSLIALWGMFKAWDSHFFHKVKKIVDHKHHEIIQTQQHKDNCKNSSPHLF